MAAEKLDQLDLFAQKHKDKPKEKVQLCNQLECKNTVTLKLDLEDGIYVGNRTCDDCKRNHFWRFGSQSSSFSRLGSK